MDDIKKAEYRDRNVWHGVYSSNIANQKYDIPIRGLMTSLNINLQTNEEKNAHIVGSEVVCKFIKFHCIIIILRM